MRTILFSDVDYTLVDFRHEAAIEGLREVFPNIADEFGRMFDRILTSTRGSVDEGKQIEREYGELARKIGLADIAEPRWCRELWFYHLVGDDAEGAVRAAEAYWHGLAVGSPPYSDTNHFIDTLAANGVELYAVTSSDSRLVLREGQLKYTPEESARLKQERIALHGLSESLDLDTHLFIGDPVSKPARAFWDQTLDAVGVRSEDNVFVLGDSYGSDLAGALYFNPTTILRRHGSTGSTEQSVDHEVTSLTEALPHILG